jgi:riboflavin kinase/FMN adenylyltransferase
LIRASKLKEAERLLGRRVSVLGSVIRGSRIARALGFPTANINPHHEVIPPPGIYAVQVVFCNKVYDGICYIGSRPTVSVKKNKIQVEVHIFDFHKKIYGRFLEIQFVKLIRGDKKFASTQDLSKQIKKDVISCRKILQPLH